MKLVQVERGALAVVCAMIGTAGAFGCGPMAKRPVAKTVATTGTLDKSLFARDPHGFIGEDKIQAILSRPLELELPARLGVLPIVDQVDSHGPGPSFDSAPPAVARFAAALRGDGPFTMVTEMIPIPSGALGMESLREIAARGRDREKGSRSVRVG